MSPELETLDQLQGGELSLLSVRQLFPGDSAFLQGVAGLLADGDIQLVAEDGTKIPQWSWRDVFEISRVSKELGRLRVCITDQGTRRIR